MPGSQATFAFTVIVDGESGPHKRFDLTSGQEIRIGRSPKSDIKLAAGGISNDHCLLKVQRSPHSQGLELLICDKSMNGTGVEDKNGEVDRLTKGIGVLVSDGARICLPMNIKGKETVRASFSVRFEESATDNGSKRRPKSVRARSEGSPKPKSVRTRSEDSPEPKPAKEKSRSGARRSRRHRNEDSPVRKTAKEQSRSNARRSRRSRSRDSPVQKSSKRDSPERKSRRRHGARRDSPEQEAAKRESPVRKPSKPDSPEHKAEKKKPKVMPACEAPSPVPSPSPERNVEDDGPPDGNQSRDPSQSASPDRSRQVNNEHSTDRKKKSKEEEEKKHAIRALLEEYQAGREAEQSRSRSRSRSGSEGGTLSQMEEMVQATSSRAPARETGLVRYDALKEEGLVRYDALKDGNAGQEDDGSSTPPVATKMDDGGSKTPPVQDTLAELNERQKKFPAWATIGAKLNWYSQSLKKLCPVIVTKISQSQRVVIVTFVEDAKVWKSVPFSKLVSKDCPLKPPDEASNSSPVASAPVITSKPALQKKKRSRSRTPDWWEMHVGGAGNAAEEAERKLEDEKRQMEEKLKEAQKAKLKLEAEKAKVQRAFEARKKEAEVRRLREEEEWRNRLREEREREAAEEAAQEAEREERRRQRRIEQGLPPDEAEVEHQRPDAKKKKRQGTEMKEAENAFEQACLAESQKEAQMRQAVQQQSAWEARLKGLAGGYGSNAQAPAPAIGSGPGGLVTGGSGPAMPLGSTVQPRQVVQSSHGSANAWSQSYGAPAVSGQKGGVMPAGVAQTQTPGTHKGYGKGSKGVYQNQGFGKGDGWPTWTQS